MMISGDTVRRVRAVCMLLLLCLVAASPLWHQEHELGPAWVAAGHGRELIHRAAGTARHQAGETSGTCPICFSQHLLSLSLLAAPVEVHAAAGLRGTFARPATPPAIALSQLDRARAPPLA